MSSVTHKGNAYVCCFLLENYAFAAALCRKGEIQSRENLKLCYQTHRGEVKFLPDKFSPSKLGIL